MPDSASNQLEIRITDRRPLADGMTFGNAGAYERLVGRVHHFVDPKAAAQADITDIDKAAVDDDGMVRFVADVCILRPIDPEKGNRRVFFDYGNRGNKRAVQYFNDAPHSNDPISAEHAGNGFLMRRGYTIVFGAWQGDLLPGDGRMLLDLPVATDNGSPLTGLVRSEYIADGPGVTTFPLSGRATTRCHPTASLDTRKAQLTRRQYARDERIPVAPEDWMFARQEFGEGIAMLGAETGLVASDKHIHVPGGFEPGWIYELVYTGYDPLVMGLGHVAVRDLCSFLKYEEADRAGNPNPAGTVEKVYGYGRSQTGRCLRDYVYGGFNADALNRRVFDGIIPHVAGAGRKWLNQRFANAVISGGQQHEDHYNYADRFPFAYVETTDHNTGRTDAICKRPDTDPLILHTQTATEYWQRRGSLVHTDSQGNDLPEPANVRFYLWSSTQHGIDPSQNAPKQGVCQTWLNVAKSSMLFRAMLDALDAWATDGTEPPPSRIPTRADGTLITYDEWRAQFPDIPGGNVPQEPNVMPLMDFGTTSDGGVLANEPPEIPNEEAYAVLVPSVDADGNEIAGVRAPTVSAPLGTYTGWNLRARGVSEGAMHEFSGAYFPFPETPEQRRATGDPRPSLLERYGDAEGYVRAVEAAARELVGQGLMLEEDVERCMNAAADWSRPLHDVRGI